MGVSGGRWKGVGGRGSGEGGCKEEKNEEGQEGGCQSDTLDCIRTASCHPYLQPFFIVLHGSHFHCVLTLCYVE